MSNRIQVAPAPLEDTHYLSEGKRPPSQSSSTTQYVEGSENQQDNGNELSFVVSGFTAFRNVVPRSREMKRTMNDKESLEKTRLANRRGGFVKSSEFNKVPGSLTRMEVGAPGYCPESDRFDTDSAASEKANREIRIMREVEMNDKKRLKNAEREEERWKHMDERAKLEEERFINLRDFTDKGKPNLSSVPYNPITLKYNDSRDGMLLKHADDSIKYRAAVRAKNLQSKSTAEGYNPITGDAYIAMTLPNRPEALPETSNNIGTFTSDGRFNRSTHANP